MAPQKKTSRRSTLSAGILAYRKGARGLEVLLVHPGGPFWRKKDGGAWSIPKGEIDAADAPEQVARREFAEELGPSASARPCHNSTRPLCASGPQRAAAARSMPGDPSQPTACQPRARNRAKSSPAPQWKSSTQVSRVRGGAETSSTRACSSSLRATENVRRRE